MRTELSSYQLMGYLPLVSRLMEPKNAQYAAALAASPRAQAAVVNLLLDRALPSLLDTGQAGGPPSAPRGAAQAGFFTDTVFAECLLQPPLLPALRRRLFSPRGAELVSQAAQLTRRLPQEPPEGWSSEELVELLSNVPALFTVCCAALGAEPAASAHQPAPHAAFRAQQRVAARELLRTLPQLALALHALSTAGAKSRQLALSCSQLAAALDLLAAVQGGAGTDDSQLTICSQADLDTWLAACEAAGGLVPPVLRLKQRCCGDGGPGPHGGGVDSTAGGEAAADAAPFDNVVKQLLSEVWVRGAWRIHAACAPTGGMGRPALLKRLWQLHQEGCRVLHSGVQQLPSPQLRALLEGLGLLTLAVQCCYRREGASM